MICLSQKMVIQGVAVEFKLQQCYGSGKILLVQARRTSCRVLLYLFLGQQGNELH